MLALDHATHAQFEVCLHETFRLVLNDGAFPLELAQVRLLGNAAPNAKREPFALRFKSATPIRLPQSIYQLENDRLGAMKIFLVQLAPTELEAIFN